MNVLYRLVGIIIVNPAILVVVVVVYATVVFELMGVISKRRQAALQRERLQGETHHQHDTK